jgi:N-methylhydantoinase B
MSDEAGADVDPVTLEVVRHACEAVCEEMNATLVRTAHSPNVTERRDCSCALFDAAGRMVAQAENIPVHLGAMPFSVRAALDAFPVTDLAAGDAVLLNDPFRGGAHLPDLTLVSPVVHEGEVVGLVANRAHHADVGGASAGSLSAATTEIHQEGLRIPPVKLYDGGDPVEAVFDLLFANVRTPDERRGDLRAQAAANATGRRRYRALVERYGADDLARATGAVMDYAERRTRAEVDDLPDGTYEFTDHLDDDGRDARDLPIAAAVTVDGDEVVVDLTGSAPQTPGPVNAVRAVTASAVYYCIRCVTDPEIPPNDGATRPVRVETAPGTLVDAEPPAAVVGGNLETSQRTVDAVFGALARAVPDRVAAAGQGTMNSVTVGGTDDGGPFAFYETQGGGGGGRAAADGMDAVHVHMSNTRNTPVEVLETAYPVRVERYALRPDSAGAGRHRGGLGLRRDLTLRTEATVGLLADRHRGRPYGLAGGEAGAPGAAVLVTDGERARLPSKTTRTLPAGATLSVRTPGGGGHGPPAERDPAAVRRDLRLGVLSRERAAEVYGWDPADG